MSDPHETLRLLEAVRKAEPFTYERTKAMSAFQFNAIKYVDVYAARLTAAADFCRANMNPGVNVGRQAMAGEVLRILEGR